MDDPQSWRVLWKWIQLNRSVPMLRELPSPLLRFRSQSVCKPCEKDGNPTSASGASIGLRLSGDHRAELPDKGSSTQTPEVPEAMCPWFPAYAVPRLEYLHPFRR